MIDSNNRAGRPVAVFKNRRRKGSSSCVDGGSGGGGGVDGASPSGNSDCGGGDNGRNNNSISPEDVSYLFLKLIRGYLRDSNSGRLGYGLRTEQLRGGFFEDPLYYLKNVFESLWP